MLHSCDSRANAHCLPLPPPDHSVLCPFAPAPPPVQTNNPRKISELSQLGITVTGRIPCLVKAGKYNNGYLRAKQRRMDHLLDSGELLGEGGSGSMEAWLGAGASGNSVVVVDEDGEVFEGELDGSFCWYDHEVSHLTSGHRHEGAGAEEEGGGCLHRWQECTIACTARAS